MSLASLCALATLLCTVKADLNRHDYCVVGAGPAGLQLGYFLLRAKRDFIIFESTDEIGSFFRTYPRHRKLISINKRHTGRTNKEFNLRHDWNSLLSDNEELLFTKYSKDYFPHADRYVDYLRDYQRVLGIPVALNRRVSGARVSAVLEPCAGRWTLDDSAGSAHCCRTLVIATGLPTPNVLPMRGAELTEHYASMSVEPADYEGEALLVVGRGNSGFEVAAALYGHAAFVHLVGRSRVRLSWDTHYVGDIRAVNNEVLDSYMLKSLDGILDANTDDVYLARCNETGRITLRSDLFAELQTLDHNPVRDGYDRVIQCTGFKWDASIFHSESRPDSAQSRPADDYFGRGTDDKPQSKYPEIGFDYQSTQYAGLYFAGALTHSLDFRKAAGGFIHGFRYTVKVLHRLLEWRNEGVRWPHVTKPLHQILPTVMKRINEGSGIYQMFSFLTDVAIIHKDTATFTYLEEVPVDLLGELEERTGVSVRADADALLVVALEYGGNWSRPGADHFGDERAHGSVDDAHLSNFLHPVFRFYRRPPAVERADRSGEPTRRHSYPFEPLPRPSGLLHLLEDFTTNFDGPTSHLLSLRRFLEFFVERDLRVWLAESCHAQTLTQAHSQPAMSDACDRSLQASGSVLQFQA